MEQVKNILILSTSNPYRTAGVVAYDLFEGFKNHGHNVKLLVENYDEYEEGIINVQNKHEVILKKIKKKLIRLVSNFFNLKSKNNTIFDYHFDKDYLRNQFYSTKRILNKANFKPDAIILLFSQYFITYRNLKELQELTNAPIIWQFADMYPFTGGCHYAWDCNGFKKTCYNCPAILNIRHKGKPHKVLLKNLKYINGLDLTAVIGSDWLKNRAEKSTLFKNIPIKKIYLSLDTDLFMSFDNLTKQRLKDNYNLSNKKYIITIMATYLSHKRKGINIILEAFSKISEEYIINKQCHLLIVGNEFEMIQDKIPKYLPYTYIKSIERKKLHEIYNMSDLFISASLQEVGPYTITEALLCSVPVVSLNHGYANEFVINNETGILVKDDLPTTLANGIIKMIDIEGNELQNIKVNCRNRTKKIVSKKKQIEEYIELINDL